MREERTDRWSVLAALLPVVAAALVWWPVTNTFFHNDDFLNLYHLVNWPTGEFLTRMHGGHLLVTRNLVFLLHHGLFGTRAELYMGAAWLTHLLNVLLLYRLVRRLTASRVLASFGATLWGVSAINEGALNWYAVYGQVLALTAVLLVLLGLSRRPTSGDARWWPPLLWMPAAPAPAPAPPATAIPSPAVDVAGFTAACRVQVRHGAIRMPAATAATARRAARSASSAAS